MFDGQQLGETIVTQVKGFMEREIAPLKAENRALEQRLAKLEERTAPERGSDGTSVTIVWQRPGGTQYYPLAPMGYSLYVGGSYSLSKRIALTGGVRYNIERDPGKDAAGIVDALKDSGELVLTLADGRLVRTGIRDGEKGADGRDGFSLDDFDCEPVDERTIRLKFTQGETAHSYELTFPVPVYRDVYKEGAEYQRGDMVTWGGALWHCDAATKDKPGTADWTLAVKKGRDGKDAKSV